jgi:ribosomal protein S12 methylthiotransferase accessory factor
MSNVVVLVGEGLLAEHVYKELATQVEIIRQTDFTTNIETATALILVLHDTYNPTMYTEAEAVSKSLGVPWLRAFVSFGEGMIGPLVLPNVPGCSQCADIRHLMAGRDRRETLHLRRMIAKTEYDERDVWASRTGVLHMSHILVEETKKIMAREKSNLNQKVFLVSLTTLNATKHFFLPISLCSICGTVQEDTPELATISLQPSPKISPHHYRCRSIEELQTFLVNDYLDYRIGFLNGKMHDIAPPFADVGVNLPMLVGDEGTAGRTTSYAMSELTAILEGLERYCGIQPRGKRTVVHDSYNNVKDKALHPLKVGVHEPDKYETSRFPFKEFDPNRPINWVWGYSFLEERPILVPELLAYYSLGHERGFVYETSNGCALGGSLTEAIFYGILEVVERDSFLLTWYAQLPLPRLDISSAEDEELELMVERVRAAAGYDIYLYNATMENGIPSVWALAKNRKKKGMNVICAAGAHPDPVRAAKSAIFELAGMMLSLDEKAEKNREKYVEMLENPTLVRQMEDHCMLYSLPEAESRLQFLLDENRPLRTFEEEFHWKTRHDDLTDELKDLLRVFHERNLDVIVVNQTTDEISRNGLHCVKVIIPGMLPMTFGYDLTRLKGLGRVLTVPMEIGYTKRALAREELNLHPHPFP